MGTCHSDFILKTSRTGPGPKRGRSTEWPSLLWAAARRPFLPAALPSLCSWGMSPCGPTVPGRHCKHVCPRRGACAWKLARRRWKASSVSR